MSSLDNLFQDLTKVVDKAMNEYFEEKQEPVTLPYSTLEEYKKYSGKKFRRTRKQMQENTSTEDSFQEFMQEQLRKLQKKNR